eukprot:CAMPEP_0206236148 /NCGR_PEP_ID=MMETSP0047_2-20121206/13549_1 /ASSEMBLY_ACC=CAM_ASM_000192 /TAXON_ID=195065 /ORGANISM="Chroomonas mesostigmatica_cf, Strain CCMP1168" /LENGTH=704 /DNA_ID=CAMNT_0053660441 /DNA_START=80 /DNA_END=2194 /DNA_ORIENTATION=-
MARSKEAAVLILDVHECMEESLKSAKAALTNYARQQMVQMPDKTMMGLVLCGSHATVNDLHDQLGGYENVCVEREVDLTDVPLLKKIDKVNLGGKPGDLMDAMIVAVGLLDDPRFVKSYEKKIILVTDGKTPINGPEQLGDIIEGLKDNKVHVSLYGLGFTPAEVYDQSDDVPETESVLRGFVEQCQGEVVPLTNSDQLASTLAVRSVKGVTTYRDYLHICGDLKIAVWSYASTKKSTTPTLKTTALGSNTAVTTTKKFVLEDDETKEVPPEDKSKAYLYGKDYVPVNDVDLSAMKNKEEKNMKLFCFTERSAVQPHWLLGEAYILVPPGGKDGGGFHPSSTALAGLVAACQQNVAIVRWVQRANANAAMYVLFPVTSKTPPEYCFKAVKMPFKEELRPAADLHPLDQDWCRPSGEQRAAARALIEKLTLPPMSAGGGKAQAKSKAAVVDDTGTATGLYYDPTVHMNPVIQRFYEIVHHKALFDNDPIPPIREETVACLKRDRDLWEGAAAEIKRMEELFDIQVPAKEDTQEGPDSKRAKQDADAVKEEEDSGKHVEPGMFGSQLKKEITTIKSEEQFDKIWSDDNNLDAHDDAIEQMSKVIHKIVDGSAGDKQYHKALSCVKHMRMRCNGCMGDEPAQFNQALDELKTRYSGEERPFWAYLRKERIEPITHDGVEIKDEPEESAAPAPAAQADEVDFDDDAMD